MQGCWFNSAGLTGISLALEAEFVITLAIFNEQNLQRKQETTNWKFIIIYVYYINSKWNFI